MAGLGLRWLKLDATRTFQLYLAGVRPAGDGWPALGLVSTWFSLVTF